MTDEQPVRDAATVMLLRDGASGIEVLLLRRHPGAAFVAGAHVFPGGAIDGSDASLGDPARVAAVREAFEEAGVLLAAGPAPAAAARDTERAVLNARDGTFAEVVARLGVTADVDALRFVSRWVTPPGDTRRFDTRFFLAAAPTDQDPCHDDTEIVACAWWRPQHALAAAKRGEIQLILPTARNLKFLDRFATVADALAATDEADADDPVTETPFGWRVRLADEVEVAS